MPGSDFDSKVLIVPHSGTTYKHQVPLFSTRTQYLKTMLTGGTTVMMPFCSDKKQLIQLFTKSPCSAMTYLQWGPGFTSTGCDASTITVPTAPAVNTGDITPNQVSGTSPLSVNSMYDDVVRFDGTTNSFHIDGTNRTYYPMTSLLTGVGLQAGNVWHLDFSWTSQPATAVINGPITGGSGPTAYAVTYQTLVYLGIYLLDFSAGQFVPPVVTNLGFIFGPGVSIVWTLNGTGAGGGTVSQTYPASTFSTTLSSLPSQYCIALGMMSQTINAFITGPGVPPASTFPMVTQVTLAHVWPTTNSLMGSDNDLVTPSSGFTFFLTQAP
jgi:hypothetical protein